MPGRLDGPARSGVSKMREVSWDDFSDSVGSTYRVEAGDAPLELTLDRAAALASSTRAAGAFRLEFRGPSEPVLEQATYSFHRDNEAFEIFIVPVARDAGGTTYEAIFT